MRYAQNAIQDIIYCELLVLKLALSLSYLMKGFVWTAVVAICWRLLIIHVFQSVQHLENTISKVLGVLETVFQVATCALIILGVSNVTEDPSLMAAVKLLFLIKTN